MGLTDRSRDYVSRQIARKNSPRPNDTAPTPSDSTPNLQEQINKLLRRIDYLYAQERQCLLEGQMSAYQEHHILRLQAEAELDQLTS